MPWIPRSTEIMKRAVNLLVLLYLFFGIVKTLATGEPEIGNDLMQTAPVSTDDPSHLAKHAGLAEKPSTSIFWPERSLFALFPPYERNHQMTTHKPRHAYEPNIIVRFFLYRNNMDELFEAANGRATELGDQDLVQNIGPTGSSLVATQKNSKSSTQQKRNKKDKGSQLAKQFSSNMLSLENFENLHKEEKNVHEKVKKSINDIYSIKSPNKTCLNYKRRLYNHVWAIDWMSIFDTVFGVLIFLLMLTITIAYWLYCCACTRSTFTSDVQGDAKQVKVTPTKCQRFKGLQNV